jgi:hypothetical protein
MNELIPAYRAAKTFHDAMTEWLSDSTPEACDKMDAAACALLKTIDAAFAALESKAIAA